MLNEVRIMTNIFKTLKDDMLDKPLIQIHGNGEILAEGCGRIIHYTEEKVIFCSNSTVEIEGAGLVMTNLGFGSVSIKGTITAIKFGDKA